MKMCLRMNSCPAYSPTDSGSERSFKRSRSCSSSIDIDSRIACAMDLVKTHMLSAVREEVESLKETIKNLTERNIRLERDNHLLRSLLKYQTALTASQIIDHQMAMTSGQIPNHQMAVTSGQIPNHQPALTSGQIPKEPSVLTSGQIPNHQPALGSAQITINQPALTSGQMPTQQTLLTSVQTPDHHPAQSFSPPRSENVICRSLDYQNNGCFAVNTQLYLNATYKHDVRCV